jgi:hypothetical protein
MLGIGLPALALEFLSKVDWLKVGLIAAIPLAYFIGDARGHNRGELEERASWEEGVRATNEFYANMAFEAAEERIAAQSENQTTTIEYVDKIRTIYAKRPPAKCLPADRVSWLAAARETYASPGERDGSGEADANPPNQ